MAPDRMPLSKIRLLIKPRKLIVQTASKRLPSVCLRRCVTTSVCSGGTSQVLRRFSIWGFSCYGVGHWSSKMYFRSLLILFYHYSHKRHAHGGCKVLGAAPQTPFALFLPTSSAKKERKEHSRSLRPRNPRQGQRCSAMVPCFLKVLLFF